MRGPRMGMIHQRLTTATDIRKREGRSPPTDFRGSAALRNLDFGLPIWNWGTINFCFLKANEFVVLGYNRPRNQYSILKQH